MNRIAGVMVSVLASNAVECGFELRSNQPKDYKISICCFSAKHASLSTKSKDWLARNQDNVWGDMSIHGLLFQWFRTMKDPTKSAGLVQNTYSSSSYWKLNFWSTRKQFLHERFSCFSWKSFIHFPIWSYDKISHAVMATLDV